MEITVINPSYPVCLNESIADKAAAPPPTITNFLFLLNYLIGDSLGYGWAAQPSLGTLTIIFPPFLSTLKVFNPPKTGPCSSWPVVILKPAL